MTIKEGILSLFRSRDKPQNAISGAGTGVFSFGRASSGKAVNERTALQTSAVYACVRILAETIASLPLNVYKNTENGREKATDHPLYHLLHNEPNTEMTSFVYRETMMTHLLLWGNSYSQIIRNGRGQVLGLYPLMPDRMSVDRAPNSDLRYIYTNGDNETILSRDDVLHIPGLGFDGLIGYSPIAMARNAIGMAIAAEEYGAKLYANGANPGGVLEHPGTLKDPAKLRDSWNAVYQGSGNAHRVVVLEDGMKFNKVSIPPNDAQFLESRKFQVEEICRIYRIPPHLVASLDRATFSNIEHQGISFVVNTIRPWLVRIEQSFHQALFMLGEKREYFAEFVVDGLLRGDYQSRMQGYATGIQNGFMSPNCVRELENMNRIPHGDVFAMNGNMIRLEDIGAWSEKYNNNGEGT